jgi:hypothetical protein
MHEGMLVIDSHNLLFLLVYQSKRRILLPPESELTIFLGGHWITGTFRPDIDDNDCATQPFHLYCTDDSFCALCAGTQRTNCIGYRKEYA